MARSYKQPSIVSGLSIDDILNMDNAAFNKLQLSDLKKVVGRLVSAGNKRLRRLEQSGLSTQASRTVHASGGAFSTKNKTLNQLRAEYIRAKQFITSQTSTIKGAASVRNEFIETMKKYGVNLAQAAEERILQNLKAQGLKSSNISKKELDKMIKLEQERLTRDIFATYDKLKDINPTVAERTLKYRIVKEISRLYNSNPFMTAEGIVSKLQNKIEKIYIDTKKEQEQNDVSVSDLFEDDEDE